MFDLNVFNERLIETINKSGEIFLSHTMAGDKFAIRFVCAQTNVSERNIYKAWEIINSSAKKLLKQFD